MASLEEITAKVPLAIKELKKQNEAAEAAAAEDRQNQIEELQKLIKENKEAGKSTKEQSQQLGMIMLSAKKEEQQAASTAGRALALQKELESQGKIAEDNKEFQKLSYQARKEDYAQRLKNATSPAAKKEIREEARADAKKNGGRLDKIAAGIGGLFEMGKKGLKTAALGGMALLSTLAIGGMMIALGKFLQSDTFKKITKYIFETLIPKLKEFYNSFFGEGGGLIKGFSTLFGDKSGVGAIVIGIAAVTALFAAAKLAKVFGPLKMGIGKLLSGIGGLAKRIPGIPGGGGGAAGGASRAGGAARAGARGGGIGGFLGNLGKGLGKGLGGLLKGIASGLAAIANPLTLLGLAAVVLAVNGIALAIRIMSPAFEPIGKMFESFGKTVRTVFGGLGDFIKAIGKTIEGIIGSIGKAIGNVIDKITKMKTAGTEATTKQIKELSAIPGGLMLETAKGIDAIKAALDGFGGGTFGKIVGSLFGGSGPVDKIIALSKKVPELMKAAEAIAILGAAGSDFAKAEAEIKRRERVAELKKDLSTSYLRESSRKKDQAELKALEGQAMAISPAGGGFGPQSQRMITAAINAADITILQKERMQREASLRGGAAAGRQTTNIDARQQNTSNNMGATGQVGLKPAKLQGVTRSKDF